MARFADIKPGTYKRTPAGEKHRALLKSKRWKKCREAYIAAHPYCECPYHKDKRVKGDVVDHIKPPRGDERLFFNPNNWQTLTRSCHSGPKQSLERGGWGFRKGSDSNGDPIDPDHPWNQPEKYKVKILA